MKLICTECRRENEAERIYCHECGARLDRSAITKAKSAGESPKETHRRLQAMLNPKGARLRHRLWCGTKLLLGAVVAAGLVQMLRAPELPAAASSEVSDSLPQIDLQLEGATMAAAGTPALRFSETDVNAYVSYKLKSKRKALSAYVGFERGIAALEEGAAVFTVERSLFGYSVFLSAQFAPRMEKEKLTAQILGGKIGRLPVHPEIMRFSGMLFSDVAAVFDRERRLLSKLGPIELHPDLLVVNPKPPLL